MCSLSAANARFCLDFFRELNKRKKNESIFFSPLSLSAAFGMVVLGARGSTLEQIEKVFHFREVLSSTRQENRYPSEECEEDEGVHSQFQALLAEVSEPGPGCCLTIANRLFGEITYPFFQQYLDSTKKFYRAELEPVNFKYTEEEVREKINFWVENETKGKIKDLFAAGFIDPSTVLVLVNAIYFKGKWAVEFKKEDTKEMYFHLNKNERRKVQMMFQEGYFNMAIIEEMKTKVIELQYYNNELSMFILLPEDDCEDFTGLEQLECALTYEKLTEWTSLAMMQPLRVKVYLPQFKMEESYVLNNTLQEMGVMNVFAWGKADLSGISMKDGLVVSKAIQKTIVEVNEEGTEAGNTDITMGSISAANAEFCFDVFKEVKIHHPNDNIFYCPLSMIAALAMVYLGARNNTEYQIEKVLHFDKIAGLGSIQSKVQKSKCGKSVNIHLLFKEIISDITAPEANYSLHIANRVYAEKTTQILPIYLKCVKKLYRSGLEMVNFKTASNQARQRINSWVKNQTNGQIRDFLEPSSVNPQTVLVLVNAIYFKGIWKTAFKEEYTQKVSFNVTEQESRPVQMMCQNNTFKVGRVAEDKLKILELPYTSGELSLLVLLPDDISGLAQLEKKISFEKLAEWTSSKVMEKKRVKVYLPRMKIEEKYNLTSVLTSLGMTDLFSPSANLSGISSAESLRISEAVHEAYMEVTEEGTEEAGSADDTEDIKHSSEFEEFRADHPFLFLIKHNPSNLILFFANAEFCFDVFKEVKFHRGNDNVLFSSLSMLSTLALVYMGARGKTQSQMGKVLHFDNVTGDGDISDSQCGTAEYIHKSLKDLLSDISRQNATYSLRIADRLYIEKTYPILEEYIKCAKKFYRAELEEVDFKTAAEKARQLINSWVEKETNGRIQDLLVSDSVDLNTALVFVNVIYFKGLWKTAFKEEHTREEPFNVTEQESRPVQMMCQNNTFKVGRVAEDKLKILELPYTSGELSLLVLLPDDISGLAQLENKISYEKLLEWTSPKVMEKKRVKVYLPRMKIEEKYNLTSVLTSLGMTDLFSPSANLSGISSAESLRISEAVHEAYMEVTEEGTEAGGSEVVTGDIEHSSEFQEFRADHPFLFLIKHNPSDMILLFGRYCSP
ncbi:hypothetical protein Nmel_000902 [Mimus melanotis]